MIEKLLPDKETDHEMENHEELLKGIKKREDELIKEADDKFYHSDTKEQILKHYGIATPGTKANENQGFVFCGPNDFIFVKDKILTKKNMVTMKVITGPPIKLGL